MWAGFYAFQVCLLLVSVDSGAVDDTVCVSLRVTSETLGTPALTLGSRVGTSFTDGTRGRRRRLSAPPPPFPPPLCFPPLRDETLAWRRLGLRDKLPGARGPTPLTSLRTELIFWAMVSPPKFMATACGGYVCGAGRTTGRRPHHVGHPTRVAQPLWLLKQRGLAQEKARVPLCVL